MKMKEKKLAIHMDNLRVNGQIMNSSFMVNGVSRRILWCNCLRKCDNFKALLQPRTSGTTVSKKGHTCDRAIL